MNKSTAPGRSCLLLSQMVVAREVLTEDEKMDYEEFHRLKNEVIRRLSSIEDDVGMDSLCDDCTEAIIVKEQLEQVTDLVHQMHELAEKE